MKDAEAADISDYTAGVDPMLRKQKKHMAISEWSHDMHMTSAHSSCYSLSECVPRVSGVWSGAYTRWITVEHGNILLTV